MSESGLTPTRGDTPERSGLYVVYYDGGMGLPQSHRVLLVWSRGGWSRPSSDQRFREKIVGYLGPLPGLAIDRVNDS